MNSYLNRISHFKGNPREIGFTAGRMFASRLEQTISRYIANVEDSKDLEKLHTGALPWLHTLPRRFQDEFEGMGEGADMPLRASQNGLTLKNAMQNISLNSQNRYEIKVYGQLDDSWLDLFGEAKVHFEVLADTNQVTTFSDVLMDQAGLVGLIRRLHGLGIVLISIRQV